MAHTLPQLSRKLVADLELERHGFSLAAQALPTVALSRDGQHMHVADDRLDGGSAADAAAYRDALGVMPPPGLPQSFLEAPDNPLEYLLQRYARTHGPFATRDVAERFGLRPAQTAPVLRAMAADGRLVQGEIRPGEYL